MEHCRHIGYDVPSSLSNFDRIQKRLHGFVCVWGGWLVFRPAALFPHRRKVEILSLFCCHFHYKCSDELHSLEPPALTFTSETRHDASTDLNHPHSLQVPFLGRRVFYYERFFPRTANFWNKPLPGCHPEQYNITGFIQQCFALSGS